MLPVSIPLESHDQPRHPRRLGSTAQHGTIPSPSGPSRFFMIALAASAGVTHGPKKNIGPAMIPGPMPLESHPWPIWANMVFIPLASPTQKNRNAFGFWQKKAMVDPTLPLPGPTWILQLLCPSQLALFQTFPGPKKRKKRP